SSKVTNVTPSGKRSTRHAPSCTPSSRAIERARSGLAVPAKIVRSSIIHLVTRLSNDSSPSVCAVSTQQRSLTGSRRRRARLRHLFDDFGDLAPLGVLCDVCERDDAAACAARVHDGHAPDLVLFQDATALCER